MSNLNNLPPFYVGQKVVYIKTDTTYTVINMIQAHCGCWAVDVGDKRHIGQLYCPEHRDYYDDRSHIDWVKSSNLRPLQEQKFPLISMKKVLEEVEISSN